MKTVTIFFSTNKIKNILFFVVDTSEPLMSQLIKNAKLKQFEMVIVNINNKITMNHTATSSFFLK